MNEIFYENVQCDILKNKCAENERKKRFTQELSFISFSASLQYGDYLLILLEGFLDRDFFFPPFFFLSFLDIES